MTTCEICKTGTEMPASLVIKFWGGKEFRILTCNTCVTVIQSVIEHTIKLLGRDKK